MKQSCVVLDGKVFHIGEWDYQYEFVQTGTQEVEVTTETEETVEITPAEVDDSGNVINEAVTEQQLVLTTTVEEQPVYEQVATNPLPEGATIQELDVVQSADGGLVATLDYAKLRISEYPPIGDQLDAMWKYISTLNPPSSSEAKKMIETIQSIKAKYPKTNS